MRRTVPSSAATTAALVLLLGACAGSAEEPQASRPHGPEEQRCQDVAGAARWEGMVRAGSTTTFDAHDDYFTPTCIEVPWNTPVTLVVTNFGHMPHTVTIRRTDVDTDVDAGDTAFVKVPATTRPLQIVCTFHIDERMFAAVVPVKDGT